MLNREGFGEKGLLRTKELLQRKIRVLQDRIAVIDQVVMDTRQNKEEIEEERIKELWRQKWKEN